MFGINPWVILGVVLAIGAANVEGRWEGHKAGVNAQAMVDQKAIDAVNAQIADNKAEAASKLRDAYAENVRLQGLQDAFKHKLEIEHVANQEKSNKLAAAYSAYSLSFTRTIDSGRGDGSGDSSADKTKSASAQQTEDVQLPDQITRDLQILTKDADDLNDDYKLCYGYINQ